jgi:F-type H+-transporting ATPase subunit gamma
MPSLRQYRDRITSVKSTRKITSAMKMVAASKLKKAQDQAEASQPYARAMGDMLARVAANVTGNTGPKLLVGTGNDQKHLVIVVTSDRGLCGGFNANLLRFARVQIRDLIADQKEVSIVCVGRKARDILKREFGSMIIDNISGIGAKTVVNFAEAQSVSDIIMREFGADKFDVCTMIYNQFVSVLTQKPIVQQLIPFKVPAPAVSNQNKKNAEVDEVKASSPYSYEPDEETILEKLLPKNISVQVFRALLDSAAGEQAARMQAMDNSTRNAGDMIKKLSLVYNRARQAQITKELIEIISGAEAL